MAVDHAQDAPDRTLRRWWLAPARWWRELLIIGVGYGLYTLIQHHINILPGPALNHAADIVRLETRLHLAVEPSVNHALALHPTLAAVANYYYVAMHEAVTPAVILWVFLRHRGAYPYARFLLVVPTLIGFALYYVVPVAPPRLLPGDGMVDTMARYASIGDYSQGPMSHTAAQFAAFPSLHLVWAMWCGAMVCWLVRRWYVRVVAVAYPICTGLVVVATANHYLFDLAGAVVVFAAGAGLLAVSYVGLVRPAELQTAAAG
ncbi:MAG: phosphatase PAP2 family protein [Actinocatenispora sp.]